MLWFDLLNLLYEISLLQTPVAVLVPVVENFLQILHFQLLQVDGTEINLLLVGQLTHLAVLFLQFLANLITGHRPGEWF